MKQAGWGRITQLRLPQRGCRSCRPGAPLSHPPPLPGGNGTRPHRPRAGWGGPGRGRPFALAAGKGEGGGWGGCAASEPIKRRPRGAEPGCAEGQRAGRGVQCGTAPWGRSCTSRRASAATRSGPRWVEGSPPAAPGGCGRTGKFSSRPKKERWNRRDFSRLFAKRAGRGWAAGVGRLGAEQPLAAVPPRALTGSAAGRGRERLESGSCPGPRCVAVGELGRDTDLGGGVPNTLLLFFLSLP